MNANFSNLVSLISTAVSAGATALAAGAGDNTETDGASVDRRVSEVAGADSGNGHSLAMCAQLILFAQAVLADGKTAVFKPTIQHSLTTTAGDFVDVAAALQPGGAAATTRLTLTGGVGGTTEIGVYTWNFDCSTLNRYLRAQVLVDLSAAATDVGRFLCGFARGGFANVPVSLGGGGTDGLG